MPRNYNKHPIAECDICIFWLLFIYLFFPLPQFFDVLNKFPKIFLSKCLSELHTAHLRSKFCIHSFVFMEIENI